MADRHDVMCMRCDRTWRWDDFPIRECPWCHDDCVMPLNEEPSLRERIVDWIIDFARRH